jgi:hypothetical protein
MSLQENTAAGQRRERYRRFTPKELDEILKQAWLLIADLLEVK